MESSRIRKVNDVIAAGGDLETAASPFLDPGRAPEDQLRTVLGRVSHLTSDWDPEAGGADSRAAAAGEGYLSPLTVLETGNTLFADYSPHNAAVFTLHDDLTWGGQLPGSTDVRESALSGVLDGLSSDAALPESNSQLDRAGSSATNFKSAHGGYRWRLATHEGQDESLSRNQPLSTPRGSGLMSPEQAAALGRLNAAQTYLDALHRRQRYVRHLIFCEW